VRSKWKEREERMKETALFLGGGGGDCSPLSPSS